MGQQLSHIGLIRASNPLATHGKPQSFSIGAGRPPVPTKLVQKIESGAFVDMVELLPERLDTADSEDTRLKRKKRSLSILEWLQCYAVYVAVVARKQPARLTDLMGYQSLIIEANMEYKNDCWIGYDRRFRQQAASCPHTPWSTVDTTLWNLAFAGHARTTRCKYCFSLVHQSTDCDLSPEMPNQSRQKKTNAPSFAFAGMKLQPPCAPILTANTSTSAIYVHRTQLIQTYPIRPSTAHNVMQANHQSSLTSPGHQLLPAPKNQTFRLPISCTLV